MSMLVLYYFLAASGIFLWLIIGLGVLIIILDFRGSARERRDFYAEWRSRAVKEAELIVRKRL